jgi:hypothetical protein
MVTYHPSYLLREEKMGDGIRAKRQVWEDMLKVMESSACPSARSSAATSRLSDRPANVLKSS